MNGVAHLCMRGHACYTFLLVCSSNDIGCFCYVFDVFMDYCGICLGSDTLIMFEMHLCNQDREKLFKEGCICIYL